MGDEVGSTAPKRQIQKYHSTYESKRRPGSSSNTSKILKRIARTLKSNDQSKSRLRQLRTWLKPVQQRRTSKGALKSSRKTRVTLAQSRCRQTRCPRSALRYFLQRQRICASDIPVPAACHGQSVYRSAQTPPHLVPPVSNLCSTWPS